MVHSAFLNPDSWYGKFSTVALNAMNKVKCSNATFAFRAVYFSFCPLGLKKKKVVVGSDQLSGLLHVRSKHFHTRTIL